MRLRIARKTVYVMFTLVLSLEAQTVQSPPDLVPGVVSDHILCNADPKQSYALYLPSSYTRLKRWPIIYAFDPEARGSVPVVLYKNTAEKFGYVVVGSNNSRNFSAAESSKAATAIWVDTHMKLAIDERRTYTTGFSGGARMAGQVALACRQCQVAGVIAHGAGYPSNRSPSERDRIPFFFAVGDGDFNWPEIMNIRREREAFGMPYMVRVFQGRHQWAPPEVFQEAIEWMQLKAMQRGSLSRDDSFTESLHLKREGEANDAARRGDAIAELSARRSLVSDFEGLKDVSQDEQKLTALKASPALREALKREQQQIAAQAAVSSRTSSKLSGLADAESDERRSNISAEIAEEMRLLRDRGAHFKPEESRLVYLRAYRDLWAQGIEAGQAEFESRHFERAELYFRLMGEIDDDPWPALLLAETRAATGRTKQAIKDLREAVKRGLKNPRVLENDANLRILSGDPEFQKLVAELKSSQ